MKIALVIWTNPDYYTVIRDTAQLLVELGHHVDILCRDTDETFMGTVDYPTQARVMRLGQKRPGLRNYLDYLGYLAAVYRLNRRERYNLIIGYDLFGFVAAYLMTIGKMSRLVYHNFDLSEKSLLGLLGRQLKRLEYAGARRAEAVIFPTRGRADLFRQEARLRRTPLIVMNCLRPGAESRHSGIFRRMLAEEGVQGDKIVVRLGSIGPGHGIEATIRSMSRWKGDWLLVFMGVPIGNYLSSMQELSRELGLARRILFKPDVPYELWDDCLHSADVGLALYEPVNVNHRAMAGAGQKMFFYLKAGLPIVVPRLPDFLEMVGKYQFGVAADAASPGSIADAVNAILANPVAYKTYARAARNAFVNELNFDSQFLPVLQRLGLNNAGIRPAAAISG